MTKTFFFTLNILALASLVPLAMTMPPVVDTTPPPWDEYPGNLSLTYGAQLTVDFNATDINLESYYNEYRLFSYENGFQWYDGNLCEFNEPYVNKTKEKIPDLFFT